MDTKHLYILQIHKIALTTFHECGGCEEDFEEDVTIPKWARNSLTPPELPARVTAESGSLVSDNPLSLVRD